ncbi:hypothetical protein MMC12_006148 [Toensbergia leucococca]|nr:hypothetical protein [Toensbergia leucococca]
MAEGNTALDSDFPWHLGIFDAHCHPTDVTSSVDGIPNMKARILTIMASRAEDQEIVAQTTIKAGVTEASISTLGNNTMHSKCQVVPSFGWHPWFSHLLYVDYDSSVNPEQRFQRPPKTDHYRAVMIPPLEDRDLEDHDFLLGLPEPRPLSEYLAQTRYYLDLYPQALIGEIGLDRSFRVPNHWISDQKDVRNSMLTPGGREGRRLSRYRVNLDHQRKIMRAQLNLAGEMQRAVSVHGVAAHGIVFETLQESWKGHEKEVISNRSRKRQAAAAAANEDDNESCRPRHSGVSVSKPFPPRICLHSYSGPPDTLKQYFHPAIPATMFFSFSQLVNFSSSTSSKAIEVIEAVPRDRILVESDLHHAGKEMDDLLERMVRCICRIKRWSLNEGVKQLACNSMHFIFGKIPEVSGTTAC